MSCVAARTARTHGIGQRGKKRAYLAQPRATWDRTWPKWRNLGPFGGSFTPSWAQRRHWLCSHFEATWTSIKSYTEVGAKWVQVGPKLKGALLAGTDLKWSRCCGHCRTETVHLYTCGPVGKMCKLQQSRALSGGLLCSKMPTPKLKLYQTDRSVHSYHSLLNYRTSVGGW